MSSAFSILERLTVCCGFAIEGVGFIATRSTIGCPVEMPPRMPPAWFVVVVMFSYNFV